MSWTVSMDRRSKRSAARRTSHAAALYGASRCADRIGEAWSTRTSVPESLSARPRRSWSGFEALSSRRGRRGLSGASAGFAGLFALDERRLLAASTDGVGTKLVLAREAGRLRDCGADLAAHCINDVLTTGAEPLFFLDYAAAHRLDLGQIVELVEGAADVCRAAGCAILGGESAEMPGVYREAEIDFAGTCVGLVERDRLIDGSRVGAGDAVLGLASSGLHANGFSLVRSLLRGDDEYDADLLLAPHTLLPRRRARAARAVRRTGPRPHHGRRYTRQPRARAPCRSRRRRRSRELDAASGVRLARRSGRGRGRAAAGLQPGHRLLRGRAGRRGRAIRATRHRSRGGRDRRRRIRRLDAPGRNYTRALPPAKPCRAASSVASVSSGYERSLRPSPACFSPSGAGPYFRPGALR